jgi:hypothetical protein
MPVVSTVILSRPKSMSDASHLDTLESLR